MVTKTCPQCRLDKPRSEFHKTHAYCKPCALAYRREHYSTHPELYKLYQIKYKFGITEQEYKDLYNSQHGICAVCEYELQGRFAVDHDPRTGDICGLLCMNCNMAAGQMWHDPALIRLLADYVERTRR